MNSQEQGAPTPHSLDPPEALRQHVPGLERRAHYAQAGTQRGAAARPERQRRPVSLGLCLPPRRPSLSSISFVSAPASASALLAPGSLHRDEAGVGAGAYGEQQGPEPGQGLVAALEAVGQASL